MATTDTAPDGVRLDFMISPDIHTQNVETKRNLQKLHKAAMEGDWKAAKEIFRINENLKSAMVNSTGMTALHVASRCGKSRFVISLVRVLLDPKDVLMKRDQQGRTALHYAASAANVKAAAVMVDEEPELPKQEDFFGYTPLFYAARWRHPSKARKMVEYLHQLTENHVYTSDFYRASNLIVAITASGCHGIALNDLKSYPDLAVASNDSGWSILHIIASQPSSSLQSAANKPRSCIGSGFGIMNILCQRQKQIDGDEKDTIELIHFVCDQLQQKDYSVAMDYFLKFYPLDPILHAGTKNGVYELVRISLSYFPELIWYTAGDDEKKMLLIHVAVEYRQEKIFNHIIKLIGRNIETYSETNAGGEARENILHLAAKLAPAHQLHSVPGPAFQMQKELQWFKAVEELVYKDEKVGKNEKGKIPMALFFEEHKDLIKDAKEWMKDTSNSCMVIAALVATVAFASMITVPGGTNDSTGLPRFYNRVQFVIFSVSNALSMISSAIALLVFLSIQTSRYTQQDFMESLPKNLLTGLFSLFVAVATMMIAFALAIGMALRTGGNLIRVVLGVNWAYIPITLVACIPAIIFTRLQLPLLIQTLNFASGPGITKRKKGRKVVVPQ